jgi:outer membrane protein OmpA-like peptidoglycan-associated protein
MNAKLLSGISTALALCACASAPLTDPVLEGARAAVAQAEADPNANQYAALDLDSAKKDLAMAEAAAANHRPAEIDQPAYLATQLARIAMARGAAKAADAKVAAGQAERDRIQLAAREREVQYANQQVAAANSQVQAANSERDQAAEQSARLQAELDQLKATQTPRGLVLTLGDVLFNTGRAELNPGAGRKLDQLAQFLNQHPERRIEIDGFTDSVGPDDYNQDLSQRRADAVKSALLSRGIDGSRITTQGFGKSFPVASNNDSGGRQLNRRVEVVIGGDNGMAIAPRS